MNEKKAIHGLACPACGGIVSIPEGQAIVQCPYCDQRSLVRGERGLRRYQVDQRVDHEQATQALRRFLSGHQAIARDAAKQAHLEEVFLAHLPFWSAWVRTLGWVFGQKKVRRGKRDYYEPKEIKIAEEMTWTGAACDVGEFGVTKISLKDRALEPFDAEVLHGSGMVFEPVGSLSDARTASADDFTRRVRDMSSLDRISQSLVRFVDKKFGLVYYPLWVLRYLYRERAFQVVVDGHSGEVLYGKAPGSVFYRAAVLVGGMALGALLMVDGGAGAIYLALETESDNLVMFILGGLALIGFGFNLMRKAYNAFRYGEQYEYRGYEKEKRRIRRKPEGGVTRAQEEER
jgi:DNA-directed RNA polymerase subunit RPC12/RpoP